MRFEEYRKLDAISLAGLIAKRQVSAEEVLETAIARAEQEWRAKSHDTPNLSGAGLRGLDLSGFYLSGADLSSR